jgi:hypothetical protein
MDKEYEENEEFKWKRFNGTIKNQVKFINE